MIYLNRYPFGNMFISFIKKCSNLCSKIQNTFNVSFSFSSKPLNRFIHHDGYFKIIKKTMHLQKHRETNIDLKHLIYRPRAINCPRSMFFNMDHKCVLNYTKSHCQLIHFIVTCFKKKRNGHNLSLKVTMMSH